MKNHLEWVEVYSNLPLKYALWTRAVGVHLIGRCVLYTKRFLDPLIWWNATGNGWNLRQPTWPKSNDVKSLQIWASWMHWASGRWGGSIKSMKVPSWKLWKWCELKKNHLLMTKSSLSRHSLNPKVLLNSKALKLCCFWHQQLVALLQCSNGKLNKCIMNYDDRLRRFNETLTNRQWMSSIQNSCIHGK